MAEHRAKKKFARELANMVLPVAAAAQQLADRASELAEFVRKYLLDDEDDQGKPQP